MNHSFLNFTCFFCILLIINCISYRIPEQWRHLYAIDDDDNINHKRKKTILDTRNSSFWARRMHHMTYISSMYFLLVYSFCLFLFMLKNTWNKTEGKTDGFQQNPLLVRNKIVMKEWIDRLKKDINVVNDKTSYAVCG